jgi:hypothetical protein
MGGPMAVSDAQGRFTVPGFKPGEKVTLKAERSDERLQSKVDLEVRPGTEIDIVLKPYKTGTVEGRILTPDGAPASGMEIWLMRVDSDTGSGISSAAAVADKEGKFRILDLEIGKVYGLSARDGKVRTDTFTFTETTKPFEMKLPRADRWLSGAVTDDKGAPLPGIRLIVNGSPSGLVQTVTDEKGRYRLDGLVAPVEEISLDAGSLGWVQFKYVLTNHTRDFIIKSGDRFISGVVKDSGGKPVPGANLSVRSEEQGTPLIHAVADADGKFRLDKLSGSTVTVSVYTRNGPGKRFTDIETNREGVVLTLDPAPQPGSPQVPAAAPAPVSASAPAPPRIAAPYPVKAMAGKAAVTVDGNLAEWAGLGAKVEPVRYGDLSNRTRFRDGKSPEAKDLSLDFQCCADRNFVYFAVKVTDDTLRFGYSQFEDISWDDGIEFQFFGDGKPDYTGQISISAEKDGRLKLEGRDPVTNEKYPYFWQAAGVNAALRARAGGYDVELAVPWSVLRWSGWEKGRLTGVNLMAYDRDGEKLSDQGMDGMVEWAASPDENYGLLKFDSIPDPGGAASSGSFDALNSILRSVKSKDWAAAETALNAAGGGPWVGPMLALVQRNAGERDKYLRSFIETSRTAPNPSVAWWAVEALYVDLRMHERSGKEDDAPVDYEALLSLPMTGGMRMNILLARGRHSLMSGKFEESRRILEEVVQSPGFESNDPQVISDTRQMLEASRLALEEKK